MYGLPWCINVLFVVPLFVRSSPQMSVFCCCMREVTSESISESLGSCLFLVRVVLLTLIFYLMCSRNNLHTLTCMLYAFCNMVCVFLQYDAGKCCVCSVWVSGYFYIFESNFSFSFCEFHPVCFLVVSV